MRSVLILAIFVLLLISCSNDFPPVPKMKFCMLEDGTCKSIHVFPEKDCEAVDGAKIIPETEDEEIPEACKKKD